MAAKIISGTAVAAEIREEMKKEVVQLKEQHNLAPGSSPSSSVRTPASVSYVTAKQKTSKDLGFFSIQDNQPAGHHRRCAPGPHRQVQQRPRD